MGKRLRHNRLTTYQGFDDDVLDLFHDCFWLDAHFSLDVFQRVLETPLVADRVQYGRPVLLELVRVLVDGVVSQVHHHVFHVRVVDLLVLLGREACKSLSGQIYPQGIDPKNEDV